MLCFSRPGNGRLRGRLWPSPDDVFATVTDAIDAGAVGCNLEDGAHTSAEPLVSLEEMLAKLTAAREAANIAYAPNFVINARFDICFCGNFGQEAFDETVSRAHAYLT
jgi:2-methylisocitrate lyase-like PEP mutase family enzyme